MGTPLTAEDMQAYCHHRPAVAVATTHVVATATAADAAMSTTCAATAHAYQGAAVIRKY